MTKSIKLYLILYTLLSIYVISISVYSLTRSAKTSPDIDLNLQEKQDLFQVRLNEGMKKASHSLNLIGKSNAIIINIDPKGEWVKNNSLLALRYAVLLHFIGQKSKSLELLSKLKLHKQPDQFKTNYSSIANLLSTLFKSKPISTKGYPEDLINKTFQNKWYKNYLLQKYYKLTGNTEKQSELNNKINKSAQSFLLTISTYTFIIIIAFIIGSLILIYWIKQWKIDKEINFNPSYIQTENPVIEGYGLFVTWLSLSITIAIPLRQLIIPLLEIKSDLSVIFFYYILTGALGLFLIKLNLNKRFLSLYSFFNQTFLFSKKDFILGLKGYLLAVPIILGISLINGYLFKESSLKSNPIFSFLLYKDDIVSLTQVIIMASILAPFFEEILFRGVIFRYFQRRFGLIGGAVTSSLLFGLVHPSLSSFLPITALGIVLAWIYHKSGSLIAPIITHMLWNTVSITTVLLIYK